MLTDDDLIDIAAGEDREAALMEVHDWEVRPPPLHDIIIRVQAHQQKIPLCPRQLHAARTFRPSV